MADQRPRDTSGVKVPDDNGSVRTACCQKGASTVELDSHSGTILQRILDDLRKVLLKGVYCISSVG